MEKVPFREKGWEAFLHSRLADVFSSSNMSPLCFLLHLPQSEAQLQTCSRLALLLFLVGSFLYLHVDHFSLCQVSVAGGRSKNFDSGAMYSKKYLEKPDQGKSKRNDTYLQQSQWSLNSVETICSSLWEGLC